MEMIFGLLSGVAAAFGWRLRPENAPRRKKAHKKRHFTNCTLAAEPLEVRMLLSITA